MESEYLLAPMSRFRINKITKREGQMIDYVVEMQEE